MSDLFSATWLVSLWERLRGSFWFLPSAMMVAAIALSFGLIEIDTRIGADITRIVGLLYTFGPEGARAILSTIASSMITVAGLTFSITMLTLQLASSQFGPRLLRNFMRDRGNQTVLGTFIGTFIYCLLVLRVVRGADDASFVPHLSVAFGVVLAIASIAVLIYFIHHVATSIRIETLLEDLTIETCRAIDKVFPHSSATSDARSASDAVTPPACVRAGAAAIFVFPARSGYIQRIDQSALVRAAQESDLIVQLDARPGAFVTPALALARAYRVSAAATLSGDEIASKLAGSFLVGAERTPDQDLEYSVRRIVEIAQRALSPGTNDPTTALYCIDRLGEVFAALAQRTLSVPCHADDAGTVRLIANLPAFDELACQSFAAVARYGLSDADVSAALISLIARINDLRTTPSAPLLALYEDLRAASRAGLALAFDRARLGVSADPTHPDSTPERA